MAQSMACMVSSGSLKLEGGLAAQGAANARALNGRSSSRCVASVRSNGVVAASVSRAEEETTATTSSRRSMLSLLAASVAAGAFVKEASALVDIKLEGPPPLSGGLPGTENADEARDFDIDLKKRFFLQSVGTDEAIARVKEAVDQIVSVKSYIDKKAWPYVRNDLRSKAQYLGFDIKTIIDSKGKPEKKVLGDMKTKLFETINKLDYAATKKSSPDAEKYYAETVDLLTKFVAKLA